ncbi:Pre-mRNA-processing factor 19 [Colletotrichum sp. SAR 10_77]|nr:Pre-mRNA-processing factor 19 [Colletotrichum sp. SAR 10_77]
MLCAISGEAPQEPVASKKSGTVFEKRLIEKYIEENGTEPVTGEALTADDLLPLTQSHIVRPRPPTLTSIPALLATFQNEWDALALETFNLKEQLARTREELATALYQHDAAVRVIARLTKERDEAREALSKVSVTAGATNGDAMAIDSAEALPEELAEKVSAKHQELSKGRKKRPVPEGWATPDDIASLDTVASTSTPLSQASSLALEGSYAAVGARDGQAAIYSVEAQQVERQVAVNEPVLDSAWTGSKLIFATSKGSVKIFEGGAEIASLSEHAGPATSLSVHPTGELLASVGSDKSIAFYDLHALRRVSRAYTDASLTSSAFHPDGHLFAAGTVSGEIKLFHTTSLEFATAFSLGAPVEAVTFSENGFWLAATAKGQSSVTIFDLRKEGDAARAKTLETGGPVQSLAWDYTGQFLATGGAGGVTVQQYIKSSKAWSEPFRSSVAAASVKWGPGAKQLVSVNEDGRYASQLPVAWISLDLALRIFDDTVSPTHQARNWIMSLDTSPEPSSPEPFSSDIDIPAVDDDDIQAYNEFFAAAEDLVSEHSDHNSNPSDRLGPRSPSFDSEADAQHDWDPEELSESPEPLSDLDTSPSRDSSADPYADLFSRPDSYPLSPDLEGELELALLAELDELDDRLPPLIENRAQRPNRPGNMAAPRQANAANGAGAGPDVLVDLELYFRQERPQRRAQQNQQGPADVIDLTNEPDSPVQSHAPRPSVNPRRQNSQGRNPPALARSDSSILAGNAPNVIDLTDDSPEVPRRRPDRQLPPIPGRNREHRDRGGFMPYNPASAFSGLAAGLRRHLYPLRLFPAQEEDVQLLGILHNRINPGDLNNPLGNIQLQYEHNAFDRAESPKPVHQPPPPAKPGYTRDTGSDMVVICPCCNEELAYDPDVPASESHPSRKGKRQRSEHHFWALKDCGHVYCEECFENRKPTAKRRNTGLPSNPEGKTICSVDGCDTQAGNKGSWVGIYL